MYEEREKIYKEVDVEFARFLIQMRVTLNEHHDVECTAVNYLKMFYKKCKAFKSSNLYSVLYKEMADFKASHKFASSSEVLKNTLEVHTKFIQNLFSRVEGKNY